MYVRTTYVQYYYVLAHRTLMQDQILRFKTTPKRLLNCQNPSTGSEVKELSFSMSADMYSDLTIELALKNYPKMTPDTLKSVNWIRYYGNDFFMSSVV